MVYTLLEILSILFFCIAVYTFFLYPILLKFLGKKFEKPIIIDESFEPKIAILIAAYNEEKYIKDCLLSVLNSNYPLEKIKILIGLDGTTDRTSEIIKEIQQNYSNIEYWDFPRSGKNFIINQLISKVSNEFVFFLDADLRLKEDSLKRLVIKFSDNSVGGIMAAVNIVEKGIVNDNAGRDGETFYQKMETEIRDSESKIFGSTNGLGTLYGVRKSNLTFQPNDKVCDDFFNVIYTAKCKKRFIFDKSTVVEEIREKSLSAEMKRRIRMVAGGLSTIRSVWQLLLPTYGWSSFFLWSHKVLRYSSPLILIYYIIVMVILPETSWLKYPLIISQVTFYTFILISYILDILSIKIKLFRMFKFIFIMNFGFLLGILRFIFGGQNSKWEKIG